MKKLLFMFALISFLGLELSFSKSKEVTGVSDMPYLRPEKINDWTYRITGTEGLSDVRLFFEASVIGRGKNLNKQLEPRKKEVLDNVSVVIEDVPYQLKFKNKIKGREVKRYGETFGSEYILEFGLDIGKNVELILPNSILIQSNHSYPIYPDIVGSTIQLTKIQNNETKIIKEYGPKEPPYTCCYALFQHGTIKVISLEEEKKKEDLRKDLIKRILKKMGYREVNSTKDAIMKGDVVLSNGGLNNPFRMFIQDVSFNGEMFSYLVATGYSQSTLNLLGGDIFYIVSGRQLIHTNTFRRGDEITENLCLEYIGTDTYRHGNTIEECKVFYITSENETIMDMIKDPEKYKYLVE